MDTIGKAYNADVLFQKLGGTWYVFSEVRGEVIYSSLPQRIDPFKDPLEFFEVIEKHMEKVRKIKEPVISA